MIGIRQSGLALMLAATMVAGTAQARVYGMSDTSCTRPPEGRIETGNGWFTLTETRYTRQGARQDLGDGWIRASYTTEAEGETGPAVTMDLRITPTEVWIKHPDGREFRGAVCP